MDARIAVLVPALGLFAIASACGGGGSKTTSAAATQLAAVTNRATVAAATSAASTSIATAVAPAAASTAAPGAAVATAAAGVPSGAVASATAKPGAAPSAAAAARPAGGKPGAIDPCTLLKREEIEAAFGQPFKEGKSVTVGDAVPVAPGITAVMSSCTFDADGLSANHVELNLDQFSGGSADQRRQLIDFICSKKEQISGIGDGACWYDGGHDELQVVKGSNLLDIRAIKGLNADSSTTTLSLVKQALARLP